MPVEVTPRGTRGFEPPRMPALVMAAMQGVFHFIYRWFGERIRVQGRPLLEIETLGARSGARRVTILGWFPDSPESDDSWIVVASNAGGSRHPGWFLNLPGIRTTPGSRSESAGSGSLQRLSTERIATRPGSGS
jgi:deazaflavin-dependent oxidoreductase (nitroreductase family)